MKKENVFATSTDGESASGSTRARAVAFRASRRLPPLKEGSLKPVRANIKKTTSDKSCLQGKRIALQDVTNMRCKTSYGNCVNAEFTNAKKKKVTKDGQVKVSKVVPSIAVEIPRAQIGLRTDSSQEVVKTEPRSDATCLTNLVDIALLGLSCKSESSGDIICLEIQKSGIPFRLPSPPKKADKVGFFELLTEQKNPNIIDIDADYEDTQLCSLYAADIYDNLHVAELERRPCPNFMETVQRDITQSMRGILVDWLVEVSEEYKLVPDTLYLTVYFIDRFLSQNYVERQRLQLLGVTCMLIASKYEEICPPCIEEFCFITDNTYSKEEVLKMEILVLKNFGFQLSAPTAKTFLRRSLRAAQACYKSPRPELEYLANYLTELTLIDYGFLNFRPSIIAASAVFLARWILDQWSHPWDQTLEHYTRYKAPDLKTAALAMHDLQLNTNGCPLSAIRMKYGQEKYKSVAALSSPRPPETLF